MNRGKAICEILKQLRVDIAKANNIEYNPTECTHKGVCSGSCHKCEEELAYLTTEIEKRQAEGITPNFEGCFTLKDVTTLMAECKNAIQHDRHLTEDIRSSIEEKDFEEEPSLKEEREIFDEPLLAGISMLPECDYGPAAKELYQERLREIGLDILIDYYKMEWISLEEQRILITTLGDQKRSANAIYQMIRNGIFLGFMRMSQPLKTFITAAELNEFIGKRKQFFGALLRKTVLINEENLLRLSEDLFEHCFLKATHMEDWDIEMLIETDFTIVFDIGYELIKSK